MLLSPWPALESLPDLNAVPAVWRRLLGQHFEPFRRTFLQPKPEPARSIPCDHCACAHEIIHQPNNSPPETRNTEHGTRIQHPSLLAICRCSPWTCPNLHLSPADIILLELSWPKLARALCRALGLNSHFADVRLHQTFQIGSWSAAAVSAILTIQSDPHEFRRVVAELVARLRQPFILLAPTSTHLDASCAELLACAQAGFFGLDSHVRLSEHGTLQP
ncbi:MAG: hypothetical protein DME25_07630, partial [Verrucomicrobia bacterium]